MKFIYGKLRNRLIIAFLSIILAEVVIGSLYTLIITRQNQIDNRQAVIASEVSDRADLMASYLLIFKEQILFLSELPSVQAYANALVEQDETSEKIRNDMTARFLVYAQNVPYYDQVRFIDADGMERVRVNWADDVAVVVPDNELQDKSDRPYFLETIKLSERQVYISPLELNVENGEIEYPYKPVIRYSVPVYAANRELGGIVILNVLAQRFLNQAVSDNKHLEIFLIDQDGYFWVAPQQDWLFGKDLATEIAYPYFYPDDFVRIEENPTSVFGDSQIQSGNLIATAPIDALPNEVSPEWILIYRQSFDSFITPFNQQLLGIFVIASLISIPSIGMAILIANSIVRPIQKLVEFASYPDHMNVVPVDLGISGDDEIAQLARTIQWLFSELLVAYREVQDLNKNLEDRVSERTQELEAALQELEAFSYTVSHDLRAPLRAMIGFSTMLLDKHQNDIPERSLHYLQRIQFNAENMGELVDDLLMLTRLGRQEVRKKSLDPKAVVEGVLLELGTQELHPHIKVVVSEMPSCQADPTLIKQIYSNLISNAIKFSQKQESPLIEIGVLEESPEPVYFVRDNGVGFDMQYADKLFQPFQRLHDPSDFSGTGIGLAIVMRVIQRHKGRVWAEAKVNEGATFFFTMPHE